MVKDNRPYCVLKAEETVFTGLAKKVLEELKIKNNIAILEDVIKKSIIEQIEKDIKDEVEEANSFPGQFQYRTGHGVIMCNSPREEFENAEKSFDELHLYGRVKKFFKDTGISTKPGRDSNGNRSYIFYDSKRIYVIKDE